MSQARNKETERRNRQERLSEAEDTLRAIREGEVDALVVEGPEGQQRTFTFKGADRPYRIIVESMQEGALTVTPAGVILYCNERFAHIVARPVEELVGQSIHEVLMPGDAENLSVLLTQAATGPVHVEVAFRAETGAAVPTCLALSPLPLKGSPAICIVATDLSEVKRLQQQLVQAQKMEAIGRLAGGIAHDFNNLLTVITSYSELLLERLGDADASREEVEEIRRAAERASALTGQLLAFSRHQVVRPQLLDLNTLVRSMEPMLRRLIGEDVRLSIELEDGLPAIKADRSQLEQVLLNLAVNGRDAMANGGELLVSTGVTRVQSHDVVLLSGLQPGNFVTLSVRDTGEGIAADLHSQIFEPFFTTKPRGKGTGLGLSTVFGIAKQAGGTVTVESAPGEGATFRVYLPALDVPAAELRQLAFASTQGHRGAETILLVDDEEAVRRVIRRILEARGYRVLEAASVEEALEVCEANHGDIDLLLTDVVMPGKSGRELAEWALECQPNIKVLYMSGYTNDAVIRHGVNEGEVTFLVKPFTAETLLNRIRQAIGTAAGGAELSNATVS